MKNGKPGEPLGRLHCVPLAVKDNMGLTAASDHRRFRSLAFRAPANEGRQTIVARLRAAGALVLFKTNMAEWAFNAGKACPRATAVRRMLTRSPPYPRGSSGAHSLRRGRELCSGGAWDYLKFHSRALGAPGLGWAPAHLRPRFPGGHCALAARSGHGGPHGALRSRRRGPHERYCRRRPRRPDHRRGR